ncbi:MAG: hypothetical protein IJH14_07820 [Solobacterium sp.]|nr:hypothetical protein [Solobacterium sp.]
MLSEKLSLAIRTIDASNAAVARYAGFDRTFITRLRSGERTLRPFGATAVKLAEGICLCSQDSHKTSDLAELIGYDPLSSLEQQTERLRIWLFEEEINTASEAMNARAPQTVPDTNSFRDRLDSLMTMAGISNMRLSQIIHVDPSLISRYRNGSRVPKADTDTAAQISQAIYDLLQKSGRIDRLSSILPAQSGIPDEPTFFRWLFSVDSYREQDLRSARGLLSVFDALSAERSYTYPPAELPSDRMEGNGEPKTLYYGAEGFKEAFIRFLQCAASHPLSEIMLYSDEDYGSLLDDRQFLNNSYTLINRIAANGTKVCIIHSLDRDPEEMKPTISVWFPLYLTGAVESWYSRRRRNERFSHTLLLAPGLACIEGMHISGTKTSEFFHYLNDPQAIEVCRQEFASLLEHAKPLLSTDPVNVLADVYEVSVIQNTLSIATMPEELARQMNDDALMEIWQKRHDRFLHLMQQGTATEYIALADPEDIRNGKVGIDPLPAVRPHYYTPAQYEMHMENIRKMTREFPGFSFVPLRKAPFSNLKIMLSDRSVCITHYLRPDFTFVYTHPAFCRAFQSYANELIRDQIQNESGE